MSDEQPDLVAALDELAEEQRALLELESELRARLRAAE